MKQESWAGIQGVATVWYPIARCYTPFMETSIKMNFGAILIAIGIAALGSVLIWPWPDNCCDGAVQVQVRDWYGLESELPVIRRAAERNGCYGEDFLILLAIRKQENGRLGCEFGIKDPLAWDTNLATQAGWAAATIVKNRTRWANQIRDTLDVDFIEFLADRYCPKEDDPIGNRNWKVNVRYWFRRFKSG